MVQTRAGSSVDIYSYLDTVTEYYSFLKFDRVIEKTAEKFSNKDNQGNLGLINSELEEIKGVMDKNLKKLYKRGQDIYEMKDVASEVYDMSQNLNSKATQVKRKMMLRKYMFFGLVGLLVLMVILWKIFL